jgi:uncharacterized membrane protein YfcA
LIVLKLIAVFFAGTFSGFININAGGGSLVAMPVLLFLGLPIGIANGTNRVSHFFESVSGVISFKRLGYFDYKYSLFASIFTVPGAIAGSFVALKLSDNVLKWIFAFVLVLATVSIFLNKPASEKIAELQIKRKVLSAILYFFIGLYGGVVQIGVGYILMAVIFYLTKVPLLRVNSIKTFLILIYIAASLVVFIIGGKVNFLYGLVLAAGNATGVVIGIKAALKKGDSLIKVILLISVSVTVLKLITGF